MRGLLFVISFILIIAGVAFAWGALNPFDMLQHPFLHFFWDMGAGIWGWLVGRNSNKIFKWFY